MLVSPMDIHAQFPVRKTRKQKQAFLNAVQSYMHKQRYPVSVEKGIFGSRNLVIGDPDKAAYVVTAHYDTGVGMLQPNRITPFDSVRFVLYQVFVIAVLLIAAALSGILIGSAVFYGGIIIEPPEHVFMIVVTAVLVCLCGFLLQFLLLCVLLFLGPASRNNANDNTSGIVTLMEIARSFPENQRHKVCFVLFDLDQTGLWGAKSYRKLHREALDRQLVINLDCVGDGDFIYIFPTRKLKENRRMLTSLYKMCGYMGKKSICVHEKGFGYYPSDHVCFPYGAGICALRKNKRGYFLRRTSKRAAMFDETNVNILRAALTTFICRSEVN